MEAPPWAGPLRVMLTAGSRSDDRRAAIAVPLQGGVVGSDATGVAALYTKAEGGGDDLACLLLLVSCGAA